MAAKKATKRRRTKLWRFSAGERGRTVEVCERELGGMLYYRVTVPDAETGKSAQRYRSLKHRDQERAKTFARELAERLRHGAAAATDPRALTFRELLRLYLLHRTPEKASAKSRDDDQRRAEMWLRVTAPETRVVDITLADWDRFRSLRASGVIDARGRLVAVDDRAPVGPQAVAHDGRFLRAVFYWGMRWRVAGGATLLTSNPFGAPAPGVQSAFVLPKNKTPRRPIVADARYLAVRTAAARVLMEAKQGEPGAVAVALGERAFGRAKTRRPWVRWRRPSYLVELLTLSWETGRRRGAILDLRHADLVRQGGRIVAIRWRPTKHAEGEQVVPVSAEAQRCLEGIVAARPGVGTAPLFPSHRDPARPVVAEVVDAWLREAERLAEVPKQEGGLWHPYRRSWATRRKHLSDTDVAAAGGWKTIAVMKESYQLVDDATLRTVVNDAAMLEERQG